MFPPYNTSGANETIFMNFLSLSSLATGPKIRVPLGCLSSFIITLNDMRLPLGDTMFNNVEDMKNVIEIFPTKTLESFMDLPGVRFSQFENYLIETGECNG